MKRIYELAFVLATLVVLTGCTKQPEPTADSKTSKTIAPASIDPQSYEASAEELLAARLPPEESVKGWIRLFDGHTLYGWEITGAANWRIEDGSIVVDDGAECLLCTSVPWQDFELTLQYKAHPNANSGVFLRTPLQPEDPSLECYEVNIAPNDNPFPTAGIVGRQKASSTEDLKSTGDWQTMRIVLNGKHLQVTVDDKLVNEYVDPVGLAAGRIGLQHNSGRIEFRDIKLKPIGLNSLIDKKLSKWTKYPDMPGDFSTTDEGWLHVQGGRTQLESKETYGDFVLLTQYRLPTAEMNSGIFFRCIPGEEMMGYECQLSNEVKNGNPLAPADTGTGGIFKRQDARVVAGEVDQWSTLLLNVHRQKVAAWVEGIQVSNWFDDRKPDANPRKGLRLQPGTIMIQGHDPTTDATLKELAIKRIE